MCTLGCGALAGTSYPVDRVLVAELLGFDGVRENTVDAVSGGDHVLEATAAIAGLMVKLSRFSQDLYTGPRGPSTSTRTCAGSSPASSSSPTRGPADGDLVRVCNGRMTAAEALATASSS